MRQKKIKMGERIYFFFFREDFFLAAFFLDDFLFTVFFLEPLLQGIIFFYLTLPI